MGSGIKAYNTLFLMFCTKQHIFEQTISLTFFWKNAGWHGKWKAKVSEVGKWQSSSYLYQCSKVPNTLDNVGRAKFYSRKPHWQHKNWTFHCNLSRTGKGLFFFVEEDNVFVLSWSWPTMLDLQVQKDMCWGDFWTIPICMQFCLHSKV